MRVSKQLIWATLAGLAALFLWKRGGAAAGGITVDVRTLPVLNEGGPWQAWTLVTNTTASTRTVYASISGDVGGIVLSFTPSTAALTVPSGGTLAISDFWFYIPAGTIGLSGQVTVVVDGATDTATFTVEALA